MGFLNVFPLNISTNAAENSGMTLLSVTARQILEGFAFGCDSEKPFGHDSNFTSCLLGAVTTD